MDPTYSNYGGNYYSPGMMSPQQYQQQLMYARGLIPYNVPVHTVGAGIGELGNSLVNGLMLNPSLKDIFNPSSNSSSNQNNDVGPPMQLQGAIPWSLDTSTAPGANPGNSTPATFSPPPPTSSSGFSPPVNPPLPPVNPNDITQDFTNTDAVSGLFGLG